MSAASTDRFFDRELSWLEFNTRVLAEAMDETNPLLERLKFMGIVSSNLDEFFMVRVASLGETDGQLHEIYHKAFHLMDQQNDFFIKQLAPALVKSGITRLRPQDLNHEQHQYVANLFRKELMPLLTPIALRKEHPMPDLVNLSLYRVIELEDPKDIKQRRYALVENPKNYSRVITLPSEQGYAFMLIGDIVSLFAQELFPGYVIAQQGVIRLTRAAEMSIDEEQDEDFSKIMTEALRDRRKNAIVRVETSAPEAIVEFMAEKLQLDKEKIYKTDGWIDLKTISQIAFQPGFENLKRPQWVPRPVSELENALSLWKTLSEKDILVHHPYESFDAFLHFLSQAANDPDVLAIKQTLYRAANPSAVIGYLEKAAENGKQVTVLVELKARFDEQRNIEWAHRLVQAGATVLYGVAGLKTHAKACLVVRREPEGIKRYLHLSTGNYNEKTAAVYSDLGYFTTDEQLTSEVAAFFNVVTGFSQPTGFSKIEVAPFGLRRKLERLIVRETMRSRKEQKGLILAKLNSLVDRDIIEALYRASQAGVQIKLNVRGVCCLKPGLKGLSENIEVVSIVDTFLEHSRIFYFYNAGDEEIFISSADWMPRNLDRRLEILCPLENKKIKNQTLDILKLYFKDNVKSWLLHPDGTYKKKEPANEKKFRVQEYLCKQILESEKHLQSAVLQELKPQKPKTERSSSPETDSKTI